MSTSLWKLSNVCQTDPPLWGDRWRVVLAAARRWSHMHIEVFRHLRNGRHSSGPLSAICNGAGRALLACCFLITRFVFPPRAAAPPTHTCPMELTRAEALYPTPHTHPLRQQQLMPPPPAEAPRAFTSRVCPRSARAVQ